jgi:hypothetical protein
MLTLVRLWGTIDQADRDTWNAYAVEHTDVDWTNSPRRITGMNWFCRCNIRMLDTGQVPVHTAPIAAAPSPPELLTLTPAPTEISVAWAAGLPASQLVDLYLYGPHSPGIMPKRERAKHYAYDDADAPPKLITGLAVGTYSIWIRAVSALDGLASSWLMDTTAVPAA